MEVVASTLHSLGYRVTRNVYFKGAKLLRKHCAPDKGIHSLQIEMNRSLYMDEVTGTRRPELAQVTAKLAAPLFGLLRNLAVSSAHIHSLLWDAVGSPPSSDQRWSRFP